MRTQTQLRRYDAERDLLRRWERLFQGPGEDRMSGSTPAAPPAGRAGATAIATSGSTPDGSTSDIGCNCGDCWICAGGSL